MEKENTFNDAFVWIYDKCPDLPIIDYPSGKDKRRKRREQERKKKKK